MNPQLIEIVVTVSLTLLGVYVKDLVAKTTMKQRVQYLEEAFKEFKSEIGKLDDTLNRTNQGLSSVNATMKGLSLWIERVEERINKKL